MTDCEPSAIKLFKYWKSVKNKIYRKTVVPIEAENGEVVVSSRKKFVINEVRIRLRKWFSRKTVEKRLPFLVWSRRYNLECLFGDFIAGFTVGLMVIPQALAYSIVAGLTPNYGLYSSFIPPFLYAILGTMPSLNIGPTAITALMTYQYTSQGGADYVILLCFLTGVLQIIAAIANVGFLINFISQPVISGFTSAAAITIASSQLNSLLGLSIKANGLLDTWIKVIGNLGDSRWQDFVLGTACMIALTLFKDVQNVINWKFLKAVVESKYKNASQKFLFFLCVSRNAIVVIIASYIAFVCSGDQTFTLTGFVQQGIPSIVVPPFSTEVNNSTMSFIDMISDIGIGVVVVPFVAFLENIALLSAFAGGKSFDATQEIFALGASNLLGSFFRFIPRPTLAAVTICAVINMINFRMLFTLWRIKRKDVIPFVVTFFACLFWSLECGIILGVGCNLSMLLFFIAVPTVKITVFDKKQTDGIPYILVNPSHGLSYPSSSFVRCRIQKAGIKQGRSVVPVVVDCSFFAEVDFTSAKRIKEMVGEFEKRNQPLVFLGLRSSVLKPLCLMEPKIQTVSDFQQLDEKLNDLMPRTEHSEECKLIDGKKLILSPNATQDDDDSCELIATSLDLREDNV